MTDNYEPKLTNIEQIFANMSKEYLLESYDELRWLAPEKISEKLITSYYKPYTQKCEIFSFGMLMWELVCQKIPYKSQNVNDELLTYIVIRDEFKDLIELAWKNCPDERICLSTLYLRLSKLSSIAHSSATADSCVNSDLISHKSSQDNFRQRIYGETAEIGNVTALFNLDVYLHGKMNVIMDKSKGLKYLKLAALKGHMRASEMLKNNLGIDLLDIV
ncbi:26819_t:CDS:2 [Dentiscutata erythropus]|uniref:26819_t:CDS:1 n=1 Tax=Dentiscutata erythropus TaxID=1348616 RepID=A0A9N9A1L8_9GLOM|nr:26819_t:CDS:2 [Dentiscutata erythropus]